MVDSQEVVIYCEHLAQIVEDCPPTPPASRRETAGLDPVSEAAWERYDEALVTWLCDVRRVRVMRELLSRGDLVRAAAMADNLASRYGAWMMCRLVRGEPELLEAIERAPGANTPVLGAA